MIYEAAKTAEYSAGFPLQIRRVLPAVESVPLPGELCELELVVLCDEEAEYDLKNHLGCCVGVSDRLQLR